MATYAQLLTSESNVLFRNLAANGASLLSGRWVVDNGSGVAVNPSGTVGVMSCYWLREGTVKTSDAGNALGAAAFAATTPYLPIGAYLVTLPSNTAAASDAVAAAYGVFRAQVGPEGYDAASTGQYTVGAKLKVDAAGRLIATATATDIITAVVESFSGGVLAFKTTGQ